jgi:membrane fusion protein, multidrug efflux system
MSFPNTPWLALAVLTAALTSCSRSPRAASPADALRNRPAVPVTVAVAKQQDVPVRLEAIGTVRAYASISIKARVDGELAHVAFRQGDEVKKGALIFQIDPRPFQAVLDQAQGALERDAASLKNAQEDMRRTDALAGTRAVAATDVDANRAKVASLQATVSADRAAVESARLNLSFCSITAPVAGRIGLLLVDAGNMVKSNDTVLAVVNQMRPIYVDFSVPEQSLLAVRDAAAAGQLPVTATIPQHPDRSAEGQLAVINNQVDSGTGTLPLRAVFPNQDELLWPGQFVNVTLTLTTDHNAVVVPTIAVQLGQEGQYVWVVKPDNTVAIQTIQPGSADGGFSVIQQGLRPGDRVVTSGSLRLVAGTKVKTVGAKPAGGPAGPAAD